MAKRYTDEFRRDAVGMATTSGLTTAQQLIRSIDEGGAAPAFIGFGGWAFEAEQMGSTASIAQQGIAQQCPEREHDDLMIAIRTPLVRVTMAMTA
jgi:hypothetical protein